MAIDDGNSVDAVSQDPVSGNILLDIADQLDWSDEGEHLLMLQEKINAYIGFIESGQLLEGYPEAVGKKPEIHVACLHRPSVRAEQFFSRVAEALANADIAFSYRQSHFNSPPHAR